LELRYQRFLAVLEERRAPVDRRLELLDVDVRRLAARPALLVPERVDADDDVRRRAVFVSPA
jgi:hypothetical protein